MRKTLSLIVAVYNYAQYLEFILVALQRQSMLDFEVIIADDGSGPEIRDLINRYRPQVCFPIQHLWQPDHGFHKNKMLNRAIEASQTEYLIFIDGDCVPHHEFIRDHWISRQPFGVHCGRRVNFSKQMTKRLTLKDFKSGRYENFSIRLLIDGLMARSSNLEDAVRIKYPFVRRVLHRNRARILGCNFSVEKRLLERINGFNEDYEAPGLGEDSDVASRLEMVGARPISLRYLAVLFHLYHSATQVGEKNKQLFERALADNEVVCRHGLRNLDLANQPTIK